MLLLNWNEFKKILTLNINQLFNTTIIKYSSNNKQIKYLRKLGVTCNYFVGF